ncbi:hypothetical protein DBT_2063 [Dissulfuribacter thermophilus]|uniref:Uncharacterized protein n=1 Tax=Dissulfuribacter thermophilus TaxID=1156395 RepID=A0A1B9F441_9BACT|nr:hypothetical protein DBT_2063 [Dissulfuribacter thermophilus]
MFEILAKNARCPHEIQKGDNRKNYAYVFPGAGLDNFLKVNHSVHLKGNYYYEWDMIK